ncbi:MAG TPA: ABC transporter permease [Bryobacteraceae bacterium]|nr:ABC transporter permease [Bryobacteraceae bacterium]
MRWDSLTQDIRYASRSLRRDKGFFTTAILVVGLGIGANTAIFGVVNTLLFRPLQVSKPDRLVLISNTGREGDLSSVTSRVANYLDWRRSTRTMEDMAAWFAFFDYGTYSMVGAGDPERLVGVDVSQNFLSFLGVQPALGRGFTEEEAKWQGSPAVILTHGLWQRRFGADPNIIGRALTLNDRSVRVVGVLPASFDFSTMFTPGSRVDILVPFPLSQETDRWGNTLAVLGRLRPNVTVQQAQAEFDVINEQIRRAHPDRWTFGAKLTPLQEYLTGRFRRGLLVLLCAVAAVLLVGCTNLSNLMLSRAASRRKEMAIRSALGAGRTRLIRQMLTESLFVSILGALLGLIFAWVGIRSLSAIQGFSIPLLRTVRMDSTALLFTTIVTLATAFLFGLIPAIQTSGHKDAGALKDAGRGMLEGRGAAWTRGALVISEVALACVLLVGAGLLLRSFVRVLDVNLGFRPENAASWRVDTGQKYSTPAQQDAFYERLVRAVEAVPGVASAGITDALPLSRDRSWGVAARGVQYPKGEMPLGHPRLVDRGYLRTMGIPFIAGRDFDARDTSTSEKVIVVNRKMARRLWPGQNPLGQIVSASGERRVVGVVGNVRHQALEEEGGLEFYLPLTQASKGSVELVVRTRVPLASAVPAIQRALRSVDGNLPTAEYHELSELIERAVSPRRFLVMLLGAFAVAALLLASIGIYGVVSYSVGRRTQEIGIRMALGATASAVRRQVMKQTVALVSGGIAAGLIGALIAARLMSSLLYRLEPADPITLLGTMFLLLVVAILAAYAPARRASRVDPMASLRTE